MKILIDADGCPVVDLCIKAAKRHGVECLILCDTAHIFEREGARTVTVSKGADSVDFKTVNLLERGDIVVTQDYGLAAMCLARGARALNQNGLIYTSDNIDALLNSRYEAKKSAWRAAEQRARRSAGRNRTRNLKRRLKRLSDRAERGSGSCGAVASVHPRKLQQLTYTEPCRGGYHPPAVYAVTTAGD